MYVQVNFGRKLFGWKLYGTSCHFWRLYGRKLFGRRLFGRIPGNDMCKVHSLLLYNHTTVMKMYVYLVIKLRIGSNTVDSEDK